MRMPVATPRLVHPLDELLGAEARGAGAAEVRRDVGVRLLAEELRGALLGDEVDPDVDDVGAVSLRRSRGPPWASPARYRERVSDGSVTFSGRARGVRL